MLTIWKYELTPRGAVLQLPAEAAVLTVQVQRGAVVMWVLLDPELPNISRRFEVFGTGHDIEDAPRDYIGTFQLEGGALIFHVFERFSEND